MAAVVEGLAQLQKNFEALAANGLKKAVRAGVGAAMTQLAKGARRAVNASNATPAVKRAARLTIGKRFQADVEGKPAAKIGFGVGKPTKAKRTKARERSAYGQGGAKLARGVGLSSTNIHWAVLGTQPRRLKEKKALIPPDQYGDYRVLVPGDRTGAMKPSLFGVLASGAAGSYSEAAEAAALKVAEVIAKEAKKKG